MFIWVGFIFRQCFHYEFFGFISNDICSYSHKSWHCPLLAVQTKWACSFHFNQKLFFLLICSHNISEQTPGLLMWSSANCRWAENLFLQWCGFFLKALQGSLIFSPQRTFEHLSTLQKKKYLVFLCNLVAYWFRRVFAEEMPLGTGSHTPELSPFIKKYLSVQIICWCLKNEMLSRLRGIISTDII